MNSELARMTGVYSVAWLSLHMIGMVGLDTGTDTTGKGIWDGALDAGLRFLNGSFCYMDMPENPAFIMAFRILLHCAGPSLFYVVVKIAGLSLMSPNSTIKLDAVLNRIFLLQCCCISACTVICFRLPLCN
jgi:hypothetical protein